MLTWNEWFTFLVLHSAKQRFERSISSKSSLWKKWTRKRINFSGNPLKSFTLRFSWKARPSEKTFVFQKFEAQVWKILKASIELLAMFSIISSEPCEKQLLSHNKRLIKDKLHFHVSLGNFKSLFAEPRDYTFPRIFHNPSRRHAYFLWIPRDQVEPANLKFSVRSLKFSDVLGDVVRRWLTGFPSNFVR